MRAPSLSLLRQSLAAAFPRERGTLGLVSSSLHTASATSRGCFTRRANPTSDPQQRRVWGWRGFCSATSAKAEAGESSGSVLPWLLGAAGLIPFVALTPQGTKLLEGPLSEKVPELKELPGFACLLAKAPELQQTYAATIVSFLGAIHWGTALSSYGGARLLGMRYLWGVTPSLLAWASLSLPSHKSLGSLSQPGLCASLLSCYAADMFFSRQKLLPPWYFSLRLPLTIIACGSLSLSWYTEYTGRAAGKAKALVDTKLSTCTSCTTANEKS